MTLASQFTRSRSHYNDGSQHCICGHERRVHFENCAMCHACQCVSFARTEHLGGEWSPAQHGRAS